MSFIYGRILFKPDKFIYGNTLFSINSHYLCSRGSIKLGQMRGMNRRDITFLKLSAISVPLMIFSGTPVAETIASWFLPNLYLISLLIWACNHCIIRSFYLGEKIVQQSSVIHEIPPKFLLRLAISWTYSLCYPA